MTFDAENSTVEFSHFKAEIARQLGTTALPLPHVHVIRAVGKIGYNGFAHRYNEFNVNTAEGNPAHVVEMTVAAFYELFQRSDLSEIAPVDCRFDAACVKAFLDKRDQNYLVVSQSYPGADFPRFANTIVVDMSSLVRAIPPAKYKLTIPDHQ
jgi:hypothetical protein